MNKKQRLKLNPTVFGAIYMNCQVRYSVVIFYGKNESIPEVELIKNGWWEAHAVQVVTDESWINVVIASENPVVVEFWAPGCGPCQMIEPIIDDLAREYAGKILCCKVNTDDSPNIATQYGIKSIPIVLFFKNGERKVHTIEKYIDA